MKESHKEFLIEINERVMRLVHIPECHLLQVWLLQLGRTKLGACPNTCQCGKELNRDTAAAWQIANILRLHITYPPDKKYVGELLGAISVARFCWQQHPIDSVVSYEAIEIIEHVLTFWRREIQ